MKSNNPANIISAKAKKKNLSYWSYMAEKFPGSVQAYVWPTKAKKGARKDRSEVMQDADRRMRRGKAGLKFLMGMRNLVSGR